MKSNRRVKDRHLDITSKVARDALVSLRNENEVTKLAADSYLKRYKVLIENGLSHKDALQILQLKHYASADLIR